MKILLVHNFYQSTHVGGEDLVFEQEKKALIIALGAENVFTYTVSNDKLNKFKLIFGIWHHFFHARNIYKLINKNKINIMHAHNYFPLLTPSVFKAAKKAGAKVVYTLHNYREWCLSGLFYRQNKPECYDCANLTWSFPGIKNGCYRDSKIQSLLAGLAYGFYKMNNHLRYVDRFFVLSETQKKILQKIQTPIMTKTEIKPSFVQERELGNILDIRNRKNYLFVGRLEKIKGVDVLLKAWAQLDSSYTLEIIGTGPGQAEFKKQYNKNNIIFLGKLPRNKVVEKMAQAKYFIHPGIVEETQGLTLLEALAQGTPVIGFSIGTRKEYIQDGYNGFLCEPENLVKNIIKAENIFQYDFEKYQALCQSALLSVQAFLPSHITAKQLELYHNL